MNFCIPEDIEQYMAYYGMHFNRKLCDFAISRMRKKDKVSGNMVKVVPNLSMVIANMSHGSAADVTLGKAHQNLGE